MQWFFAREVVIFALYNDAFCADILRGIMHFARVK